MNDIREEKAMTSCRDNFCYSLNVNRTRRNCTIVAGSVQVFDHTTANRVTQSRIKNSLYIAIDKTIDVIAA